jgi:hypothetical protein
MEVLKEIVEELKQSTLFKWFQDIATLLLLIVILYIVYVFMFALIPPPIESF